MVHVAMIRLAQGAAIGIVCRPNPLSWRVGQSVSMAALQLRVCADGTDAGAGASKHDPAQAFEDWRGGLAQHEKGAAALEHPFPNLE